MAVFRFRDWASDFNTTEETSSVGVTKYTYTRKSNTGVRIFTGIFTLGLTETPLVSHENERHEFYYGNTYLGSTRNQAAVTAFTNGVAFFRQGNFEEAQKWFNAAYFTCEGGYSEEMKFKNVTEAATIACEAQNLYNAGLYRDAKRKFTKARNQTTVTQVRDVLSNYIQLASDREVAAEREAAARVAAEREAAERATFERQISEMERAELEMALIESEQEAARAAAERQAAEREAAERATFEHEISAIDVAQLEAALLESEREISAIDVAQLEAALLESEREISAIHTTQLETALLESEREATERATFERQISEMERAELEMALTESEQETVRAALAYEAAEREAAKMEAAIAASEREAAEQNRLEQEAAEKDALAREAAGIAALERQAAANAAAEQCITEEKEALNLNTEGLVLHDKGRLKEARGKIDLAVKLYKEAVSKFNEAATRTTLDVIFNSFMIIIDAFMRNKRYDEARETMNQAKVHFQDAVAIATFTRIESQINRCAWSPGYLDEYLRKLEHSELEIIQNINYSSSEQ